MVGAVSAWGMGPKGAGGGASYRFRMISSRLASCPPRRGGGGGGQGERAEGRGRAGGGGPSPRVRPSGIAPSPDLLRLRSARKSTSPRTRGGGASCASEPINRTPYHGWPNTRAKIK